ncbi:hypothetical protein PR202_gb03453 [Eleusine coracana subsp. coracana]|uniref:SAM-dependent methyltransferase RsmB-F/NOP2-type catalytic core domain-containing protein n=1 Tax=Eleusine coracana subsp. coracana TaxID=191504 RepID=A0AAV5E1U8_ELECO|nr:hypothetical protein PR202_gb03453 [Eleusine coracana subsp. coracana]
MLKHDLMKIAGVALGRKGFDIGVRRIVVVCGSGLARLRSTLQGRALAGGDSVELLGGVGGLTFSLGEGSVVRLLALDAVGFSCQTLLLCCSGGGRGHGGWRRGPNHRGDFCLICTLYICDHFVDPQPGERILDMCAAPGGKTTAIAILMEDKGEVVALDRSHNKVMDILKLAAEMDLNCIKAYKLDALKSVRKTNEAIHPGMEDNLGEAIETVAENSDPCNATVDGTATNVGEDSSITVVQSGGGIELENHRAHQEASQAAARRLSRTTGIARTRRRRRQIGCGGNGWPGLLSMVETL